MPLTDIAIRNTKPGPKAKRIFDSGGLYLEVSPTGGKWWRLKYRCGGKEKRLSLGTYPEIPLAGYKDKESGNWVKGARDRRDEAKRLLAEGVDPSLDRKAKKLSRAESTASSFEALAAEFQRVKGKGWSDSYRDKVQGLLKNNLLPWIGAKPISDLKAVDLLLCLKRVEDRGAIETAHKCRSLAGEVFRYAVATGRAERDISVDLRGALSKKNERHMPTITDPKQIAKLLRDIDACTAAFITRCALKLAPMLFVRPGELRQAEWAEIDLESAEWRIPAGKMKAGAEHVVPLARQAIEILRELQPLTGGGRYVFRGVRDHDVPMSENTLGKALRAMGYTSDAIVPHGFRAMASTLLNEQGWHPDAIERQLAHKERNAIRAAYHRASYLPERKRMMQGWCDYLDTLKAGAEVIPIHRTAGGA
ncbi:MAG: tyrosine-type recombinase/integrase [Burkholderiales bacterium]